MKTPTKLRARRRHVERWVPELQRKTDTQLLMLTLAILVHHQDMATGGVQWELCEELVRRGTK